MKLLLAVIVCATASSIHKPTHIDTRINFLKEIKEWYCNVIPYAMQIFDCDHTKSIHDMKYSTNKIEMKEAKNVFCHTDVEKSNNSDSRCTNYNSTHEIVLKTNITIKYNVEPNSYNNQSSLYQKSNIVTKKVELDVKKNQNVTFDNFTVEGMSYSSNSSIVPSVTGNLSANIDKLKNT